MHTELDHGRTTARLLRALPDADAGPYDYREFQRRAHAVPAGATSLGGLRALAAVIVVALAVMATAIRFGDGPRPQHLPAAAAAHAAEPPAAGEASPAEGDDGAAQYWLDSMPREPALVRVGTRAAVETLEDHIAQVDDLLSSARAASVPAARVSVLRAERAQLVDSLVQVRYAETLADAAR